MRDIEFITALKEIVKRILLGDISRAEIVSLIHQLEAHDIWDSDNLMITDCYYTIKHMWEEHISKTEWKYFLDCFSNQRSFNIEEKCALVTTFPDRLDDATVLEFSEFGNFGRIKGDDRPVRYFAICQYPNDVGYYLFFCAGHDYDYDVIIDDLEETIEMCKKRASKCGNVVWHRK